MATESVREAKELGREYIDLQARAVDLMIAMPPHDSPEYADAWDEYMRTKEAAHRAGIAAACAAAYMIIT